MGGGTVIITSAPGPGLCHSQRFFERFFGDSLRDSLEMDLVRSLTTSRNKYEHSVICLEPLAGLRGRAEVRLEESLHLKLYRWTHGQVTFGYLCKNISMHVHGWYLLSFHSKPPSLPREGSMNSMVLKFRKLVLNLLVHQ